MDMQKKVAFITGASRGIGKAIAQALAKTGLKVAVGFNNDFKSAEDTCKKIKNSGGIANSFKINVSSRKSVESSIDKISDLFGPISILVNNAGLHLTNDFLKISDKEWDQVIDVNLKGTFICSQSAITQMLESGGGRIINIASIAGERGGIYSIPYAAAKAGVINLTRSLARLYSSRNIQTYCIAPGLVKTDMSSNVNFEKEIMNIPANRIATTDEVAKLTLFLSSQDSDYLTGQTFNFNGGEYFAV
jgi:3-oxoacyl-[acyl-carrier protein] reductase